MLSSAKAPFAAVLVGLLGIALIPLSHNLEEDYGLGLLFRIRGPIQPPAEVVVVTMDRVSADALKLPEAPNLWPRSIHARLTDKLGRAGASVIAFDILFGKNGSQAQDDGFAEAIARAGNVILCQCIKRDLVSLSDKGGKPLGEFNIENLVNPSPVLARSALALAPFPIPKVPVKVSQFWTIKKGAGDAPTMPAVAFQVFALHSYESFIGLLRAVSPEKAEMLPRNVKGILSEGVSSHIRNTIYLFQRDPNLPVRMRKVLDTSGLAVSAPGRYHLLHALISMYADGHSRYLNYYGPPGTISTISYHRVLESGEGATPNRKFPDLRGKAVFVGLSERLRPEQKDGFHTVFSLETGVDISGVEIAATAFANLLKDTPVKPVSLPLAFLLVFAWGTALGFACLRLPTYVSALGVSALITAYVFGAGYHFKVAAIWYPLVVPLAFQAPLAFFGSVLWKYTSTSRERDVIRKAFGVYLPDKLADRILKDLSRNRTSSQVAYGVCLFTDAERYTEVSEEMDPASLSQFMSRYFKVIFEPVGKHDGLVLEIQGDGILALWVAARPDSGIRRLACTAAVEIADAVERFNKSSQMIWMPTRIGLHAGFIYLGDVWAMDHYQYRAMGDIVNTASRMEGLNKQVGTRVLVSGDAIFQLDEFITRELGQFVMVGKTKPTIVHELVCKKEDVTGRQEDLTKVFFRARELYLTRKWKEAIRSFESCRNSHGIYGPAAFYVKHCRKLLKNPPGDDWNGVVYLDRK
ncbi:MAG: adenylate/guanylate cyclase domain-containing protein [Deltaproteobacteria bacterium]|nr:adenylate/guanylate cyclase domain-containing protein [Deltaproteobacteria bacterium]